MKIQRLAVRADVPSTSMGDIAFNLLIFFFILARDLKQLKTHGAASVAELREFLAQTRGRSPQEVLGMLAGSHLLRSIGVATVGALVMMVVGTIVPWWMGNPPAGTKPGAATKPPALAPAEAKKAEIPPVERPAASPPAASNTAAAELQPTPADAAKAVKVMGLGETKLSDPKKNPLEKSLDNLLDKLEQQVRNWAASGVLASCLNLPETRPAHALQTPQEDAPTAPRPLAVRTRVGLVPRSVGRGYDRRQRLGMERRSLLADGLRYGSVVLHRLGLGDLGRRTGVPAISSPPPPTV